MSAGSVVEHLVRLREQVGLTQAEVASLLGTSQPVIARFEGGGRDPRLSTVQRYARVVGADLLVCASTGSATHLAARVADRIRARLSSRTESPTETFREVVQFLDDTRDLSAGELVATISEEPLSTGDRRWDAVIAAAVDWVATTGSIEAPRWVTGTRWKLPAPGWIISPHRRLHRLVRDNTPVEFARHGVYVDAASLESV